MPPSGIRCDRVAERSRCYRLAVRTKDSQSLNRGSIPRSTTKKSLSRLFFCYIGDRTPGFSATAFCRLLLTEQFSIPRSTTKKSLSRLFFAMSVIACVPNCRKQNAYPSVPEDWAYIARRWASLWCRNTDRKPKRARSLLLLRAGSIHRRLFV